MLHPAWQYSVGQHGARVLVSGACSDTCKHVTVSAAVGRLLFAEALQQGTMTGFFKLVEQYRYAHHRMVCRQQQQQQC